MCSHIESSDAKSGGPRSECRSHSLGSLHASELFSNEGNATAGLVGQSSSTKKGTSDDEDTDPDGLEPPVVLSTQPSTGENSWDSGIKKMLVALQENHNTTGQIITGLLHELKSRNNGRPVETTSHYITKLNKEMHESKLKLHEAIQANMEWQEYEKITSQKFLALQKRLQQLEGEARRNSNGVSEEQQKEIDKILLTAKRRVDEIQDEKEELEDELRKSKMTLHAVESELASKKQKNQTTRELENLQEKVSFLDLQLQTYRNDFDAERNEKKSAESRNIELRRQMTYLQDEIAQLRGSQHYSNYSSSSPNCYPYQRNPYNHYGLVTDGVGRSGGGMDEVDSGIVEADGAVRSPPPLDHRVGNGLLICPQCNAKFDKDNQHGDFLDHTNDCCV